MDIASILQSAVALHRSGRAQQADAMYRQVLAHDPRQPDALNLLGIIALQSGHYEEAVGFIQRSLDARPDHADTLNNLGSALRNCGRIDEAVAAYRRSLVVRPKNPEVMNNLGNALRMAGKLDESAEALREALSLKQDFPEAHNNIGATLRDQGLLNEAVASYRAALKQRPAYPEALSNLGAALRDLGRIDEALACIRGSLALRPANPDALCNMGNVLRDQGDLPGAIGSYRQALAFNPGSTAVQRNLGIALASLGSVDEAVNLFRSILAANPADLDTLSNLGNALKEQGLLDDAVDCYRKALAIDRSRADIHSNIVFTNLFRCALDPQAFLDEARLWDQYHGRPLAKEIGGWDNARTPDRRLRIGYVSPDFGNHCQSLFTTPLFSSHSHADFFIACYSDAASGGPVTQRLRATANLWRDTAGMGDADVAQLIRQDKIDVLVDLTMHMARNRLLVFARKPAPVQVSWLAYPGTTGLSAIDYRLTDPYIDPPGVLDEYYSEKSVRLPDTFWCYDPLAVEPEVNVLPSLQADHITFGCLNNFCKVNEETLAVWSQVLCQVPRSRLILLAAEGSHRDRLLGFMEHRGVARTRITFVNKQSRADYLRLYHEIDLGLDTYPVNGHTTSLDSYWMGVPVVTLVGPTPVGRAGLCHLHHLELEDLSAADPEAYIRIAVDLAKNTDRLSELRRTLRERLAGSVLMDGKRFARNVEAAYLEMWRAWCSAGTTR
jgi:protein O-GlcNAc transferase